MPVSERLISATARRAAPKSSSTGVPSARTMMLSGAMSRCRKFGRVHHLQRIEQRGDDAVELLLRGRPAEAAEPGLEALPLLEAHHHVGGGVGLEHARDAHDARVLEARQRARLLQEVGAAPVEGLLVALRLRPHAHGAVAVAEVEGVVLLDRDHGAEVDVLGLVGDAEPARAHHAHDAVAAVEDGVDRQLDPALHGPSERENARVAVPIRPFCPPSVSEGTRLPGSSCRALSSGSTRLAEVHSRKRVQFLNAAQPGAPAAGHCWRRAGSWCRSAGTRAPSQSERRR